MQKPLSLANRDYMQALCDVTNNCGLPAFVIVDAVTKLLNQVQVMAENELKHDEAIYRATLQKETDREGVIEDGG